MNCVCLLWTDSFPTVLFTICIISDYHTQLLHTHTQTDPPLQYRFHEITGLPAFSAPSPSEIVTTFALPSALRRKITHRLCLHLGRDGPFYLLTTWFVGWAHSLRGWSRNKSALSAAHGLCCWSPWPLTLWPARAPATAVTRGDMHHPPCRETFAGYCQAAAGDQEEDADLCCFIQSLCERWCVWKHHALMNECVWLVIVERSASISVADQIV